MTNASPRFLSVVVFLMLWNLISGFPGLTARGDCDSIICPSNLLYGADAVWNGAAGLFGAGVGAATALAGWTINKASGLLEPPQTESATSNVDAAPNADATLNFVESPDFYNTPEDDKSNTNSYGLRPAPALGPGIGETSPPLKTGECDYFSAPPSLQDVNSNQGSVSLGITKVQGCDKVTAQLVWPVSCENTEDNEFTQALLSEMDPGVLNSRNPMCAVEGGISFWVLHLSADQIEKLKAEQTQRIRAIEPNEPMESFGFLTERDLTRSDKSPKASPAKKKGRLDKRDTVIIQPSVPDVPRLRFISSVQKFNSRWYAYLSPAGAETTVYVVDTGLNTFNSEFEGVSIQKWIFALRADSQHSEPPEESHGSCVASLITGKYYGVSKKANLIMVKVVLDIASFLNALSKIVEDVKEKENAGLKVKGYTVVNITQGLDQLSATISQREEMEEYIEALTRKYNVVVVVASGFGLSGPSMYPAISTFPALFATTYDIIVVGAVRATDDPENGKRFQTSPGGRALAVHAPGEGDCAGNDPGEESRWASGTSMAAATLSGLVAYLLSVPMLGDSFRSSTNLPREMKRYLQSESFPRYGTEDAISNGLDGDDFRWQGRSRSHQ